MKPFLAAPFLLLLCSVARGGSYWEDEEFLQWSSRYQPEGNLADIYPTWRKNADFVTRHNAQGLSYTLGMNKFGHLVSFDEQWW